MDRNQFSSRSTPRSKEERVSLTKTNFKRRTSFLLLFNINKCDSRLPNNDRHKQAAKNPQTNPTPNHYMETSATTPNTLDTPPSTSTRQPPPYCRARLHSEEQPQPFRHNYIISNSTPSTATRRRQANHKRKETPGARATEEHMLGQ